jgi:hypothetical protein
MKNVTHGLHAAMTAQPGKVDELPLGYRPRRLPTTEGPRRSPSTPSRSAFPRTKARRRAASNDGAPPAYRRRTT